MPIDDPDNDAQLNRVDQYRNAMADVRKVGIALSIVAVLGVLTNLGLFIVIKSYDKPVQPPQPGNMTDVQKSSERGQDVAKGSDSCMMLLAILVYLPVFIGGNKLRQSQGYGLGIAAAVIAMLPVSPAWIVGLPIGIWAMKVLGRSEVKMAFAPYSPPRRQRRKDGDWEDRPWKLK